MTDSGWDFEVVRVDLDGLGIDAGQRLGMVIVQPEYILDPDAAVPFRISDECREAQKDLIEKVFQIREAETRVNSAMWLCLSSYFLRPPIPAETMQEKMLRLTGVDVTVCPCCKQGRMRRAAELQMLLVCISRDSQIMPEMLDTS